MKVKKAIAYVLAGVMMFEAAGLTASEQAQASVKGKLNVKSVTLATGKSVTLKVKNKGKAKVRWSSSKKKIASVSSRGKVKAKKKGKATITATVSYRGKKKKLKCRVTVLQGAKKLRIVDEDKKSVNSIVLNKFDSVKLTGVVSPKKSNDKVMWKSYNPEVATVTSKGVVTGQYVGKTTVRAKTYSGKRVKVKVTVKAPVLSDTLKTAYIKDFKIGAAVNTWQLEGAGAYAKAKALITNQFNSITMENQMKPESLLSKENQTRGTDTNVLINEEILQKVLKLASDNGLKLRGHTLVWHSQTPEWFFHKDYNVDKSLVSKDVMRQRMESYIKKVLTYCQENYPGVVYAWDVVNEYLHRGRAWSLNWTSVYGDMKGTPSYVKRAFERAYEMLEKYDATDKVTLFYNDYDTYFEVEDLLALVNFINEGEKAKICSGIGMQSHVDIKRPTIEEYGGEIYGGRIRSSDHRT